MQISNPVCEELDHLVVVSKVGAAFVEVLDQDEFVVKGHGVGYTPQDVYRVAGEVRVLQALAVLHRLRDHERHLLLGGDVNVTSVIGFSQHRHVDFSSFFFFIKKGLIFVGNDNK